MRKFLVFASLLAAPSETVSTPAVPHTPPAQKRDPRPIQLRQFFEAHGCPLRTFAEDFIQEADKNALDWRLLPSISFIESSGGKFAINNNVFGWDSCRTKFASIRAGIRTVAAQLGRSALYRNKPLDAMLKLYNPRPEYAIRVKAVMRNIGPAYDPVPSVLN